MFVDETRISVKAGDGGNGCRSFERFRGKKYGRPNGGVGGAGGDVVIAADSNKYTLIDYRYNKHFKASSGGHGSSNNKQGKDGLGIVIKVPAGTTIRDADTLEVLRDLQRPGDKVIIAKGGAGGRGNGARRDATPGEEGESRDLSLELKLVADVGIVGYPNAGKSTLLSKLTRATPQIADYPFTTKSPNLGVAKCGDYTFVIADLPGLIEGAHEGRGLGHRFLRHVERTKQLMHLVDMASINGSDPCERYESLNRELVLYSSELAQKKQIVVATKMDLPEAKKNIARFRPKGVRKAYRISAITGKGLAELLKATVAQLKKYG